MKILVYWLENTLIRHFPIEQRDNLKPDSGNWEKTFSLLLEGMNCPLTWNVNSNDFEEEIVDWLVSKALEFEYEDNGTQNLNYIIYFSCKPYTIAQFYNKKMEALRQTSELEQEQDRTNCKRYFLILAQPKSLK